MLVQLVALDDEPGAEPSNPPVSLRMPASVSTVPAVAPDLTVRTEPETSDLPPTDSEASANNEPLPQARSGDASTSADRGLQNDRPKHAVSGPNIFGSVALSARSVPLAKVTQRVFLEGQDEADTLCEHELNATCPDRGPWSKVLREASERSGLDQIGWINRQVNDRIRYVADDIAHGVADHWSRGHETLQRGAGDCEDYAMAKMWLLQRLGHAAADMFVVAVKGPRLKKQHAVLAVRHGDGFLLLDNLSARMLRDTEITDYQPIFSVNSTGFWIHGFPASHQMASTTPSHARLQ